MPNIYRQITGLAASTTLGFDVSSPSAYNSATTYAAADCVTYLGNTFISRVGSNTGHTPDLPLGESVGIQDNTYWCQVDATTGVPVWARYAFLQAETQNVRWRDDGVVPTGAVGNLLQCASSSNDNIVLYPTPSKIKLIQVAPTAVLNVTFYG